MEKIVKAEFSRIIDVPTIAKKEDASINIEAKQDELKKLSERFNFYAIEHLSLHGKITAQKKTDMFHFLGTIDFKILPFSKEDTPSHISEEMELIFAPNNNALEQRMEDMDIDIEPMEFGSVDLGEVAAQYMYLIFETVQLENGYKENLSAHVDEQKLNPFSKLNSLLNKNKN